jgi:hypothetical protein
LWNVGSRLIGRWWGWGGRVAGREGLQGYVVRVVWHRAGNADARICGGEGWGSHVAQYIRVGWVEGW